MSRARLLTGHLHFMIRMIFMRRHAQIEITPVCGDGRHAGPMRWSPCRAVAMVAMQGRPMRWSPCRADTMVAMQGRYDGRHAEPMRWSPRMQGRCGPFQGTFHL